MSSSAWAIVVGVLAALCFTSIYRPVRWHSEAELAGHSVDPRDKASMQWRLPGDSKGAPAKPGQPWRGEFRTVWPVLLAVQALILLLGGGLLTVAVRGERRRMAAA